MTHAIGNDGKPTRIHSIEQIDFSLLKQGSIRLDKSARVPNPTEWGKGLEETFVAFPKGANAVYRDSKPHNSIQVREYNDYYLIQLDHANPAEGQIVEHYQYDLSPGQKVAIGGSVVLGLVLLAAAS